ncbi:hypothetical protein GDO81_012834 [Engystomops pustulosus]|uniref:Uncharacterized protein n=1 Tax=Engystomops pustulosus TaxID=76066 RepID=A0AAV7AW59_ENGPU|nr:hypothetical protein GDO81_012834 [Engystomops pustulosus]
MRCCLYPPDCSVYCLFRKDNVTRGFLNFYTEDILVRHMSTCSLEIGESCSTIFSHCTVDSTLTFFWSHHSPFQISRSAGNCI